MELPEDVQHEWLSVIRRLQSVSKTQGLAVVNISVLVNDRGIPIAWLEPKVKKIEPKSSADTLLHLMENE
jgi:hypothetical protein